MSCAHCCTLSSPKAVGTLEDADFERLGDALKRDAVQHISFSGGEPTLFTQSINRIVKMASLDSPPQVIVTTNGWFARNQPSVARVLGKVERLDRLNFSADNSHEHSFKSKAILNLKTWCREAGVTFSVSFSYLCKEDLVSFTQLKSDHPDVDFTIEPVQLKGRARGLRSEYDYRIANGVDGEIFCPSKGVVTYYPGLGFSACCAGGPLEGRQEAFSTLEALESSLFFTDVNSRALNRFEDSNGNIIKIPDSIKTECGACDFVCSSRKGVSNGS